MRGSARTSSGGAERKPRPVDQVLRERGRPGWLARLLTRREFALLNALAAVVTVAGGVKGIVDWLLAGPRHYTYTATGGIKFGGTAHVVAGINPRGVVRPTGNLSLTVIKKGDETTA